MPHTPRRRGAGRVPRQQRQPEGFHHQVPGQWQRLQRHHLPERRHDPTFPFVHGRQLQPAAAAHAGGGAAGRRDPVGGALLLWSLDGGSKDARAARLYVPHQARSQLQRGW
jgi:hypothetical protein